MALLYALALSGFAGLCTAFGGLFVMVKKDINPRFMSLALGFSGGVMIYISMTELLNESITKFGGGKTGTIWAVVAFFGGMLLIGLIDRLVPDANNPHELSHINAKYENAPSDPSKRLLRSGVMTAVAICIHNFPEGLTTFSMSATDLSLGIPIAAAIAIHNLPEGIAVAAPIYKATKSRKKAFIWSLLSGLSEPLGGLIGYLLLSRFLTDAVLGAIIGGAAGIMVFISLDELLPLAHEYGEEHTAIYGIAAGMAVMAISLILFM